MASLIRAYLGLLSGHDREAFATEHAAINVGSSRASPDGLKRVGDVYFGLNMGWYWPAINLDMAMGREDRARQKLAALARELDRLVSSDGLPDAPRVDDRAPWYHSTSIAEIVMSLEMMRAAGQPMDPNLENGLHTAVDFFLRTLDSYSVIPRGRSRGATAATLARRRIGTHGTGRTPTSRARGCMSTPTATPTTRIRWRCESG